VRVRGEAGKEEEEVWLCCGDRHQGRMAIISTADGKWNISVPKNEINSRVISVGYISSDLVVLGTLDFNLHAFHCASQTEVWSVKMPDSVLAIQSTEDRTVFAALADGFVAVLQNVTSESPDSSPLLVHIGSGAVTCLALASGQQLWCGCGNAITILSPQSFEPMYSIAIEELKGKVYKMVTSNHGVWVSFRS
jgi:outer membrane protein assembly factor BamB